MVKYFKNSDLVRIYNVSDKSVRNWIQAAKEGKLELELFEQQDKFYVADTLRNGPILESLADRGRKYRNTRSYREIYPTALFYETYSDTQIVDIISSLESFHEFPHRLRCRKYGAHYWNNYLEKLYEAGADNILSYTVRSLAIDEEYILSLSSQYEELRIIDLGPGNGLAIKELVARLNHGGKLRQYIGIDPSLELLGILKSNISKWFNGSVEMETYARDFTYESFSDITLAHSYKTSERTVNIVLLTGGIILNCREPGLTLQTIRRSLSKDDIFITTLKLDNDKARRFFDFNVELDKTDLPPHNRIALDLLGLDKSLYDIEQYYDVEQKARVIRARLKFSISLIFDKKGFMKTLRFAKGDTILLLTIRHYSDREILKLYQDNQLDILQATKSQDGEYLMIISKSTTSAMGRPLT